jgi:phage terminase large subunit-like protein
MVEVPQQFKYLSAPMKELLTLVEEGRFHHDGNPILTWCISNVEVKEDNQENIKPGKAKAGRKIDGATALINALSRKMMLTESVYLERAREGGAMLTRL